MKNGNTLTLSKSLKLRSGRTEDIKIKLSGITDEDIIQAIPFMLYAYMEMGWNVNVFHEEMLSKSES